MRSGWAWAITAHLALNGEMRGRGRRLQLPQESRCPTRGCEGPLILRRGGRRLFFQPPRGPVARLPARSQGAFHRVAVDGAAVLEGLVLLGEAALNIEVDCFAFDAALKGEGAARGLQRAFDLSAVLLEGTAKRAALAT